MSQTSSNNRRIAKNTLALFFRTFVVMAVSIYTSRVILNVLGVENFGIYNVVGGFVTMFSLLSSTLTASSQRFISYELGKAKPNMSLVFSGIVSIHAVLAIIIFVLFETVGLWFLNTKLNINADKMLVANFVYQCSVLTFLVSLMTVPYNAMIIAYEKMHVFSYISIYEAVVKLGLIYLLNYIELDKLAMYAVFMLSISVSLSLINILYCRHKLQTFSSNFTLNRLLCKDMLSFSGWNFIGSSAGILNNQGINVLINIFWGVALNAARGIAEQVNNALNSLVLNFMTAMYPQITKCCASKNYKEMTDLMIRGGKYASFLFSLLMFPFLFETETIVEIWLGNVPAYVPLFIRFALFFSLFQALSQTLYIGMLATGNIKKYQIIVGGLSILAFPVTYVAYKLGGSVEFGYISTILFSVICFFARLILLKSMINHFSPTLYLRKVVLRLACVFIPSFVIIYLMHSNLVFSSKYLQLIVTIVLSELFVVFFIILWGMERQERLALKNIICKKINIR